MKIYFIYNDSVNIKKLNWFIFTVFGFSSTWIYRYLDKHSLKCLSMNWYKIRFKIDQLNRNIDDMFLEYMCEMFPIPHENTWIKQAFFLITRLRTKTMRVNWNDTAKDNVSLNETLLHIESKFHPSSLFSIEFLEKLTFTIPLVMKLDSKEVVGITGCWGILCKFG